MSKNSYYESWEQKLGIYRLPSVGHCAGHASIYEVGCGRCELTMRFVSTSFEEAEIRVLMNDWIRIDKGAWCCNHCQRRLYGLYKVEEKLGKAYGLHTNNCKCCNTTKFCSSGEQDDDCWICPECIKKERDVLFYFMKRGKEIKKH
jgi:hypothetical protein